MTKQSTIFIVHGTKGTPQSNWFSWLKNKLEAKGFEVILEQYPTPKDQNIDSWLEVLKQHEDKINCNTIFVGHSIAASFFLHYLEKSDKKIDGLYVAGGFLEVSVNEEYDALNKTFMKKDFDFQKIQSNCGTFNFFHSEDDPYVPIAKAKILTEKVQGNLIEYKDAGHFNNESGYNIFWDMYNLILKNRDLDIWHANKKKTSISQEKRSFHEREVWFAKVGENIGFEQNGKGTLSLRPVLVYKKFSKDLFLGIPLTRTEKNSRFYEQFTLGGKMSVAILSQVKLFDAKRLVYSIGRTSIGDFKRVKEKLIALLQ